MNVPPTTAFQVIPLEGARGLRLVGELDLSTVGPLEAALDTLPADSRPTTLDLADLTFMDVSGLHAFERYAATLNGSRPLLLVNVSEHVRRVFEIVGANGNGDIELRGRETP